MPGILPMKVIKVGTSAQTRIAQACDRCRSKKIRCDGFRPTCTQCANVGFECKTSDKLSRRAFPRGYTESLEERVRALESEMRDMMNLLDEKEEKIDLLSKMHSNSPSSRRPSVSPVNNEQLKRANSKQRRESVFKIQQSPYLVHGEGVNAHFAGNSSSRAFLMAFKRKLQETGKAPKDIDVESFYSPVRGTSSTGPPPTNHNVSWTAPSRLHSDQMVNIYFQEWAPLFPVLYRPAFLGLYEQYIANSDAVQDKKSLAQLNLVFGIATLSNQTRIAHQVESCERQWTAALDSFIKETSLMTLQCLVLAQIYHIQKGELDKVVYYKGLAVAMSQRLGLHVSQKRFSLGVLTVETRKKIFWSLYVVDCFSAALMGLPRMLREDHIECEYPVDADDENVTEKGFQPSVPGEYTKISSALALFRGCRIMAKVLEQNYPSTPCHESSLQDIAALDQELEDWSKNLPPHLKLQFVQDKPSTNITSSRSPLLSLTYNFIRTLIHRPPFVADLGDRASASAVALAAAYKQMIQITQLLDERSLSFSHCLNKNEMLLMSGIGLLFHSLELDEKGKLMKDSQRLVCSVIKMLEVRNAPGATHFKYIGCSMLSIPSIARPSSSAPGSSSGDTSGSTTTTTKSRSSSDGSPINMAGSHRQLAGLAARFTLETSPPKQKQPKDQRRSTSSTLSPSSVENPIMRINEKGLRPLAPSFTGRSPSTSSSVSDLANVCFESSSPSRKMKASRSPLTRNPAVNLDYFSFEENGASTKHTPQTLRKDDSSVWENLLDTLKTPSHDNSSSESIYDWPQMHSMLSPGQLDMHSPQDDAGGFNTTWPDELWNCEGALQSSVPPQSVLSFSEESLTSGEEFSSVEYNSSRGDSVFQSIIVPQGMTADRYSPESLIDVDGLQQND